MIGVLWVAVLSGCGADGDTGAASTTSTPPDGDAETVEAVPAVSEPEQEPVVHPLQINEICASNRDVLVDEAGNSPDWFELRNPHDVTLELGGFGLSDDTDDPFAWVLPDGELGPGEVLLVLADGVEAPFKLAALGETLVVTGPDGREHDRVTWPRLYSDQSLGRSVEDGGWLHYLTPTPGEANTSEGRVGFTEPPEVGSDGGFHEGSYTVWMDHPSDTAILHFIMGSRAPTTDDGIYGGAFDVTGLEAATVRAIAVDPGLWPSRIATLTQFLDRPFDLPVWAITSDRDDLFSKESGIMHFGNYDTDWEVDTHLELYDADGERLLATDAGLKLHGGSSTSFDQKSLRLLFRDGYGVAPVSLPLFGAGGVAEFDRMILRNAGHDDGLAELRDPLSHEIMQGLDLDLQGWQPVVVYLNEQYWGLYHLREKQDRHYLAAHHGVDPDALDVLEGDGSVVNEGDSQAYLALWNDVVVGNLANPGVYEPVAARIDLPAYALYQAIEIFSGNYDWPGNNVKFWRPRSDEGRWRWALFDTEAGWNNWIDASYDSVAHATQDQATWWPYPQWSTALFLGLLESLEFRDLFLNTFADLLNTRFAASQTRPVFDRMVDAIDGEIALNQAAWGHEPGIWETEVRHTRSFLSSRPDHVWDQLLAGFGLQGTWALDLDVDPPGAGWVELPVSTVMEPMQGDWFLDVPLPLTAVSAEGWVFVGWSDAGLSQDASTLVPADGDRSLVALFELAP